ncbi:hypothetical protein CPB86DRAFT_872121 [Serendipita vermifera]|nr:hypothetical protein CPB86DRAFT_872121 [Serendipita vermifera]
MIEVPAYRGLVKRLGVKWGGQLEDLDAIYEPKFVEEAMNLGLPERLASDAGSERTPRALLSASMLPQLEELFFLPSRRVDLPEFHIGLASLLNMGLLSKNLRVFRMGEDSYDTDPGTFDLKSLIPAFLYPLSIESRRTILSQERDESLDENQLIPTGTALPSHRRTSNVECLELYGARVHGDELQELLQLPRCLKKFIYRDVGSNSLVLRDCPRGDFGRALDQVAHSLEVFDIQ